MDWAKNNLPGKRAVVGVIVVLVVGALLLCSGCRRHISDRPIGPAVTIPVPLGLPPVPIPADNPPTAKAIELGRKLFYDKRLSHGDALSCASCHDPDRSFSDKFSLSHGVGGALGLRNAPTIVNSAYMPFQFWDGRAISLEAQALAPIADPVEMNQSHDVSVEKLAKNPAYKDLFRQAFGSGGVTIGRVENALASFERTILSGNSPFDQFQYGGNKGALTPAQLRGLSVFLDPTRGNCAVCHTVSDHYALFTDGKFHNTGEGVKDDGSFSDVGRYHETKVETDRGAFMTPTLRNIALTAPYMHDGSLKTLKEVVDFYAGNGNSNPNLDPEMKKIHLSGQDRADLVEFLQSLTGQLPPNVGPPDTK